MFFLYLFYELKSYVFFFASWHRFFLISIFVLTYFQFPHSLNFLFVFYVCFFFVGCCVMLMYAVSNYVCFALFEIGFCLLVFSVVFLFFTNNIRYILFGFFHFFFVKIMCLLNDFVKLCFCFFKLFFFVCWYQLICKQNCVSSLMITICVAFCTFKFICVLSVCVCVCVFECNFFKI